MTVKSIVEVEVNGGAFQRFSALYDRYQQALKKSPEEWAKVTKEVGRSRDAFDKLVKQQIASAAKQKLVAEAMAESDRIQVRMERRARGISGAWAEVARNSSIFAVNIARASGAVIRTAAAVGGGGAVIGGLLGLGGLFGVDRLAGAASDNRRASLGLGIGAGARSSFGINFSRLVDPDSFLSSVTAAKTDVAQRVGLVGAGLSGEEIGGDTGQTAAALLRRLKHIADTTSPQFYQQVIQARQLGQFTSSQDLLRLRNTSGGEFQGLMKQFGQNQAGLNVSDETGRKWQDFLRQLDLAGKEIQATFVNGLVRLAPGLEKLSDGVSRMVDAFLKSDAVKKGIDSVGEGLDRFAKYVGTPEFQQNVKEFADGLGKIVTSISSAVRWFAGNTRLGGLTDEDRKAEADRADRVAQKRKSISGFTEQVGRVFSGTGYTSTEEKIREVAKRVGLDPDVALKVARSEGLNSYFGDVDATGKPTSFGPYQLHYAGSGRFTKPGLGEQFTKYTGKHASDPSTVDAQIEFALRYAKQNGWGPWHGWTGPPNAGGAGTGTKITIDNNTGGNTIVGTSQVAQ